MLPDESMQQALQNLVSGATLEALQMGSVIGKMDKVQ